MKIQYNGNEHEYARGIDGATGNEWIVFFRSNPYKADLEWFRIDFKKTPYDKIFLGTEKMETDRLSPETVAHFRDKILGKDLAMTANHLESEIEDTLWRMLSNFEDELQKKYEGKFAIDIDYSDITVNVDEIEKPKDKASKEIEEVLKELNRIYKGQYKFDYTSEEKYGL
jgi:hypothetical protein